MGVHKIVKSAQSTMIVIEGNPKNPEPMTAVIKFPGGVVEVTRTSDNKTYWASVSLDNQSDDDNIDKKILDSRVEYTHEFSQNGVPPIPDQHAVTRFAIRVG